MEELRIYEVNYEDWFGIVVCLKNENVEHIICERLNKKLLETDYLTIRNVEHYKIKISDLSIEDFVKLNEYLDYNNKKDEIENINTYKISYHCSKNYSMLYKFFTGTKEELKFELERLKNEHDDKYNFYFRTISK